MSRETAKNFEDRIVNGDFEKYLHGNGIDVGGGADCLVLPNGIEGKVQLWDLQDGDAQYLHSIKDNTFDFVYSSHCLEHMRNVKCALTNWIRVCKGGGYCMFVFRMKSGTKKEFGHQKIIKIISTLLQLTKRAIYHAI